MLNKGMLLTSRQSPSAKAELNMVPFIDVMLVLLVILLASVQPPSNKQIALPSMGRADSAPKQFVLVQLQGDSSIRATLAGQSKALTDSKQLDQTFQTWGVDRSTPVLIQAAKDLDYGAVMSVVDDLRSTGYGQVALAVQAKHGGK